MRHHDVQVVPGRAEVVEFELLSHVGNAGPELVGIEHENLVELGGRDGQFTRLVDGRGESRPSVQIIWVDGLGSDQGVDGRRRQYRVVTALQTVVRSNYGC